MISMNGYLDPGRITWWQEKWVPNPIELSQTNSGTPNVYVNINFRPYTSVNSARNLGIVQLNVPPAFSITGTYYSDALIIKGGVDMTASFKLDTSLPYAGVYGPFQVITRSSSTGQIYDANYVFGCVAVSASVIISSSSLTTDTTTLNSITGIVGSKDALTFLFTVPAGINLWKNDIFEIIPDSNWGVPANPICSSVDISTTTNYIKGPNNDNNLPCAIAATGGANGGFNTTTSTATPATNSVYIYGLSQEMINNSGYQIKLQVSSFTFPYSAITSSSFAWTVKIWRWGTTNLISEFRGSGPLTPAAGKITISSWIPYNSNIASTDIPGGSSITIFTKLTFKLSHQIPKGGKIDITFNTAADISTAKWWEDIGNINTGATGKCFLNIYVSGVSCSVSSSTATISVAGHDAFLEASKDISITLLTVLSSGAKVTSIYSSDGSYTIDRLISGVSWAFSTISTSSYSALTDFKFAATNTNNYPISSGFSPDQQIGGNLSTSQYLVWLVQPSTSWTSEYVLSVYLPISSSGVSLLKTYIDSSAQYFDGVAADTFSDINLLTTNIGIASSLVSGTPGTISITFSGPIFPGSENANKYFAFGYGDPGSGATKTTALPFVKSNVGTFYECWAKVFAKSSTNTPVEFSNFVFSVYTLQWDDNLSAVPMCADWIAGFPFIVKYHALNLDFNFGDSTNHYSLDVSFTKGVSYNLGTGLIDGNEIPIPTTSTTLIPTAIINSNTVTITGKGTITATNTAILFLQNGGIIPTDNGVSSSITFYFVLTNEDPTIQYQLYTGGSTSTFKDGSSHGWPAWTFTSPANDAYYVGGTSITTTGSATLSMDLTINAGDYIGVGIPSGFTVSSGWVTLGGVSSTNYFSSSLSSSIVGGFIIGIANSTSSTISKGSRYAFSFSFGGVNAALSTGSVYAIETRSMIIFAASSTSTSEGCTVVGLPNLWFKPATITSDSCSIDKAFTNGADSVDSTLSLSFTTVNPVPGNGRIIITLASGSWTVSSSTVATTCEGVGFTDYSVKDMIYSTCTISGTTLTLKGFGQVAAGVVTVKIFHVIPTTTTTAKTIMTVYCFTSVITYNENGYYIDTGSFSTNSVTLAVTSAAGTTNDDFKAIAYPNVPGATADIYLSFSLSKPIPAGSIVSITAGFVNSLALTSSNIQNSCWTDQYLTSCSMSGTTISLTIENNLSANKTIQVYLDSVLVLPNSNSTTAGWTISSTWNGVIITADSTTASPAIFPIVVGTAISDTFTVKSIVQVNSISAGESSSYLFSLSSSAAIATTDSIVIQFPKDFDPHIGDAQPFLNDCLPNNFYLTCSSSTLGVSSGTFCAVDHWYVTIVGISKQTVASSTFDITVNNVRNPAAGTTIGKFSFYQYGSLKSYSQSTQTTTIGVVAANVITIKNVTVDSTELSTATNYNFNFYAANTYTPDYIVSIIFPQQFNNQLKMGSISSCKAVVYDESSSSSSITNDNTFSSLTTCIVNGNNVTLGFPTRTSLTTKPSSRINIQLTNFYNPQWGFPRASGWDVSDYNAFTGTIKTDSWSNKFDIVVNQLSTGKTYAKSYGVLNSGFVGYSLNTTNASVGNYDPSISLGGIKLLPGHQSSDIVISLLDSNNWPLKSKSLILTPFSNKNYPDNGNLKYTSVFYNYKAFQMGSVIKFRVAASISAIAGIYYIDWEAPSEKIQDGSTTLYSASLSILVEVCSNLDKIAVSVDSLPILYQYYASIPVKVSLPNAPHTQLIVIPASSVAGFTFTPTSLTFGTDVTEKYFQVYVDSTYKASTTPPSISYTLSGTDAGAFSAPKSQTATVSTSYPKIVTVTPGITGTKVSGSEYKISVTTNIAGVLYWGLGCQGSQVLTFTGLYDMVSGLVNPSSSIQTLQEQLADEYAATETDIDSTQDADISAFFNRIHRNHCKKYWASSLVIPTTGVTIDLNWLMAGTSYTFTAYIATKLTNDTSTYPLKTYSFTTNSMASVSTTSVTFSGSVDSSKSSDIAQILAKNMGINPSWLTLSNILGGRLLEDTTITTTFTYNVFSDSRYPNFTSQDMIANLNKNSAQAKSDFTSILQLIVSALGTSTAVAAGTTPSWITAPTNVSVSNTAVTFSATSSQAGIMYATCSNNNLTNRITYAWQVKDGLDAVCFEVLHNYTAITAATSTNITISGLIPETAYECYFTACNNAPLNPLCIDYIENSLTALKIVSIKAHAYSDDSNAVYIGVECTLAFLLNLT